MSESLQATYTIEALEIFRTSGMVATAFSYMYDSNQLWNYNWLRPDNSAKPIVEAVRQYMSTH